MKMRRILRQENARQAESVQRSEGVRRTEEIREMEELPQTEELPQKEDTMTHGRLPSGLFLACIWLAGLLITARFHISQYLHTRKCILESARPCRDKGRICSRKGFFRNMA